MITNEHLNLEVCLESSYDYSRFCTLVGALKNKRDSYEVPCNS